MTNVKYAHGSFETADRVALLGFAYTTEASLNRKLLRAKRDGWEYDGVYVPLKQVERLPSYVDLYY